MNATETETVAQFIARLGITCDIVSDRGLQVEDGWEHHAYVLRLSYEGRTMDLPWRQGLGIVDSALDRVDSVLDAMLSDARSLYVFADETEEEGFERWAGDYGYDTDSRAAWNTHRAVVAQTDELRVFLGEHYGAALDTEAL